jgi:tight adherence protein B
MTARAAVLAATVWFAVVAGAVLVERARRGSARSVVRARLGRIGRVRAADGVGPGGPFAALGVDSWTPRSVAAVGAAVGAGAMAVLAHPAATAVVAVVGVPAALLAWRRWATTIAPSSDLAGVMEVAAARLAAGTSPAMAVVAGFVDDGADGPEGARPPRGAGSSPSTHTVTTEHAVGRGPRPVAGIDPGTSATLVRSLGQGAAFQVSLDRWASANDGDEARLVADAFAVAGASGGSVGAAIHRVVRTLRDRGALELEIVALGSQARLSAQVLTIVPLGFAAVAGIADHRVAAFTLHTPAGWTCVLVGLSLDLLGAAWMRRLVGAIR